MDGRNASAERESKRMVRGSGQILVILVVAAIGLLVSRLIQPGDPTLGANDRSRWATVRSLAEEGTYVVGHRKRFEDGTYKDTGIVTQEGFTTIDKVLTPDTQEFYSSKPPLFSTIVAVVYWLLNALFGVSIVQETWVVTRCVLIVVNVVPLIAYWYLIGRIVSVFGRTHWGRFYVMCCSCFGTFVTTFAITLNNHTVAAVCALIALYCAMKLMMRVESPESKRLFAIAGLFTGLTTCMELPAAAFAIGLLVILIRLNARRTMFIFLPMLVIPITALLITNYLAIGDIKPAYSKLYSSWYEFEGSAWKAGMGDGIDGAGLHEGKLAYGWNLLIGHHGFFSLTPVFFLALWPLFARRGDHSQRMLPDLADKGGGLNCERRRALLLAVGWQTLFLAATIFGFYLVFSSNYGGNTCGLRWFIWLTPFFLISIIPAVDRLSGSVGGRWIACMLLLVSIVSANYRMLNPWSHPWIYDIEKQLNLLSY